MKKPRPATNFLHSAPALRVLKKTLQEQERLLSLVRSLLPPPLDCHCLYVQHRENSLLIYTESSAWASRLRYFSNNLRNQLQEKGIHFGKINVRVLIDNQHKTVTRRHATPLSSRNASLIRDVAEDIQDADLSAALKRLSDCATT